MDGNKSERADDGEQLGFLDYKPRRKKLIQIDLIFGLGLLKLGKDETKIRENTRKQRDKLRCSKNVTRL